MDSNTTFLFGRGRACDARITEDEQVSRHHFIIEANPPEAVLRDLGSLNGTYLNDKKQGGRDKNASPEDAATVKHPAVPIRDGDQIRVGKTTISVTVREAVRCAKSSKVAEPLLTHATLPEEQLRSMLFSDPGTSDGSKISVPGCTILEEVGRGPYGSVYKAARNNEARPVAVKVLIARGEVSERARTLFAKEMEIASRLTHPNLVRILDFGIAEALFFIVSEYCSGGSLASKMRERGGTLSYGDIQPWIHHGLEALADAHRHKFVHGDIKPSNILLQQRAGGLVAKLSDMGLMRGFQKLGLAGLSLLQNDPTRILFQPRELFCGDREVSPASDVWSFAATLYHALTGAHPYPFDGQRESVDVVLGEEPIPLEARGVALPAHLQSMFARALDPDPSKRFHDAGEMLDCFHTE